MVKKLPGAQPHLPKKPAGRDTLYVDRLARIRKAAAAGKLGK